jgi:hypothetical protein
MINLKLGDWHLHADSPRRVCTEKEYFKKIEAYLEAIMTLVFQPENIQWVVWGFIVRGVGVTEE